MKFIALHQGPTVQWGAEITTPGGIPMGMPYCTTNLWALADDGHVYALAYDLTLPGGSPPSWVRFTQSKGDVTP